MKAKYDTNLDCGRVDEEDHDDFGEGFNTYLDKRPRAILNGETTGIINYG